MTNTEKLSAHLLASPSYTQADVDDILAIPETRAVLDSDCALVTPDELDREPAAGDRVLYCGRVAELRPASRRTPTLYVWIGDQEYDSLRSNVSNILFIKGR